jgi:Concanavalin A-like lectin/glucanases superfamily
MKNPKIFGSTAGVTLLRENQSTPANGIAANITGTYNTGHMLSAIKRCYLANTEVESIGPAPELVVNGTFDVDTSGWTPISCTQAVVSGRLELTATSGTFNSSQSFTAKIGARYVVNGTLYKVSGSGSYCRLTIPGIVDGPAVSATVPTSISFAFTATSTSHQLQLNSNVAVVGDVYSFDNISVKEVIPDRSYKASAANIYGTLVKTQVASATQLVAFSGFSAVNYGQEPYSADLDMGVGDLSVSAWVSSPAVLPESAFPALGSELVTNGAFTTDATGWTGSGATLSVVAGQLRVTNSGAAVGNALATVIPTVVGKTYRLKYDIALGTSSGVSARAGFSAGANDYFSIAATAGSNFVFFTAASTTTFLNFRNNIATAGLTFDIDNASILEVGVSVVAERAAASGASIKLGMDAGGKLAATIFDGTTTRTVTTTAAYNTGACIKARLNYSAGKLSINVNGIEVASTVGAPLLTLNNPLAVLTIGNSRTLDAAFPGSITLAKISATVPTPEQAVWMYEQEKQMFRDGAQITLPAATAVLDLAYDEQLDKWVAIQAGSESSFTGLIRTATGTPSAGSFSKVSAQSGVKLMARTTTSPGVDVTVPAYGLREELVRRGEAAAKASKTLTVFDYDSIGFTATTTNTSNQLTIVASVVGTPYIGMGITGTGIPANTTISGINGATYMMSAAATATGTVIALGQSTFTLSAGWTTTEVLSAGNSKREGATKDFVRTYDGFKETIKFAVAPGSATWVQLTAKKE